MGETLGQSSLTLTAEWIRRQLVRQDHLVACMVQRGWTDRRELPRWSSAPLMSALAGVAAPAPAPAPGDEATAVGASAAAAGAAGREGEGLR